MSRESSGPFVLLQNNDVHDYSFSHKRFSDLYVTCSSLSRGEQIERDR